MRQLRSVTPAEFNAYVAAYTPPLTASFRDGVQYYEDTSTGDTFPESLVASYLPASPPRRRRATGHRIPATETDSPLTETHEG